MSEHRRVILTLEASLRHAGEISDDELDELLQSAIAAVCGELEGRVVGATVSGGWERAS